MTFRSTGFPSSACQPLLMVLLALVAVGCSKTSVPSTAGSSSTSASKPKVAEEQTDPAFRVPDGPPNEIMDFVKGLSKLQPSPANREKMGEFKRNFERAIATAADKILAQDADDESLKDAVRMKMNLALRTALERKMPPISDESAAKSALELAKKLQGDKRPAVAEIGGDYLISARAVNLGSASPADRKQLTEDAVEQLRKTKGALQAASDINMLVSFLQQDGHHELIPPMLDSTIAVLDELGDDQSKSFAESFRSKMNRIRLPGSQIELDGKLLDGSDFDWPSYRGKVVLIDFWATWCGPCVQDLPHVKATWERYHAKGFEVVGISLDHERKSLESFLERSPLPWATLFSEPQTKTGSHAIAAKYEISSIPTAFLVDREGKVISTEARGPELDRQLQKMFE